MTVRPRLPALVVALLLGLACSYAVACGESEEGLLSPGRAEGLKANLDDLDDAVAKGQCERASQEVQNLREQLAALPSSTDRQLRRRLEEGVEHLAQISPEECTGAQTTETTTTETTPTETTPTETTPTETTPPETTPTQPPDTTPTVPPETPPGGEEAPSGAAGDSG